MNNNDNLNKENVFDKHASGPRLVTIFLTFFLLFFIPTKSFVYTVFEGVYGADFMQLQICEMWGTAWWGGQHYVNFFFRPTDFCESYDWTWHVSSAPLFINFFVAYLIAKTITNTTFPRSKTKYFSWFNQKLIIPVLALFMISIHFVAKQYYTEMYGGQGSGGVINLLIILSLIVLIFSKPGTFSKLRDKIENFNVSG